MISQPFIDGRHGEKATLIQHLEELGLQALPNNRFRVDGGPAGPLTITDAHEDNVLFDRAGASYLIDVHFRFESRQARLKALQDLGLWDGPVG